MKYIDSLVKKLVSESLDKKADEIAEKINQKLSGEMEEDWGSEDDFFADLEDEEFDMPKRKEEEDSKFLGALKRARKRKYGNDMEESIVPPAEDFDYVQAEEGECNECGEMEEELHGNQSKIDVAEPKGKITAADFAKLRKKNMNEKWEGDTKVEKTGEYSDMSVDDLNKAIKDLKSKTAKLQDEGKKVPKSMKEKMSELYFAKRAKQGWKGKGSAKVDEEMEEGNAFTGALAKAKEEGDDRFEVDGKEVKVKNESYSYSISFGKDVLKLTEEEMVSLIEELVLEEKGKSKGMVEYDRVHKKDSDINKDANKASFKKMKDYVKAGSKGSFEENAKDFPKGNGELAKMDKKAYIPSDAVDEYVSDFAYPGMTNLTFDEIKPDDERIKKYLEGDSTTGNSSEYANAVKTDVGKKFFKNYKDNAYGAEQKEASYKRVTSPVDVAGENKGAKSYKKTKGQEALDKLSENVETKEKENILSEEMLRMKQMIGYNKKSQ